MNHSNQQTNDNQMEHGTIIHYHNALRPAVMKTVLDPTLHDTYEDLTGSLAQEGKKDPVAADYVKIIGDRLRGMKDSYEKILLEQIRDKVKTKTFGYKE